MDEIKEKIIRHVQDDEKIVTYKGLSLSLAISIPDSRKYLLEYYEENKDSLDASFVLTGKTAKGIEIKIVKSDKLEQEKNKFDLLFSTLIYSVQQKDKLTDDHQLYNVDVEAVQTARRTQHRYCQILYKGGVQMTDDEMAELKKRMAGNAGIQMAGSSGSTVVNNSLFSKKPKQEPRKPFFGKNAVSSNKNNAPKSSTPKASKFSFNVKSEPGKPSPSNKPTCKKKAKQAKKKGGKITDAEKITEAEKLTQNDIDDEMDFLDDMILSNKSNSQEANNDDSKSAKKEENDKEVEDKEKSPNSKENKKEATKVKESPPNKKMKMEQKTPSNGKKEKTPKAKKGAKTPIDNSEEPMETEENENKVENKKKSYDESCVIPATPTPEKKSSKAILKKLSNKKRRAVIESSSSSNESEMDVSPEVVPQEKSRKKKRVRTVGRIPGQVWKESGEYLPDDDDVIDDGDVTPKTPKSKKVAKPEKKTPNFGSVKLAGGKSKKRVMQSRTYLDDDGCMVTEKNWVEVDCSDGEQEVKKSPVKKPVVAKKPPVKQIKKQSSLMSFFPKKAV